MGVGGIGEGVLLLGLFGIKNGRGCVGGFDGEVGSTSDSESADSGSGTENVLPTPTFLRLLPSSAELLSG